MLQVLTCTEHEQERLQWYCRNCQRLLCPLCKLRRVHHGHKVLPIAQAYQALKVSLCVVCFDFVKILMLAALICQLVNLVLQDKVTKEVNFILANQETIQSQITQLEAAIKQMEVNYLFSVLHFRCFVKVPLCLCPGAAIFVRGSAVIFFCIQWNLPSHVASRNSTTFSLCSNTMGIHPQSILPI